MAVEVQAWLGSGLSLIEKCETVVTRIFERKDVIEDNVGSMNKLERVYDTLSNTLRGVQSSQSPLDPVTQQLIAHHANSVQENLRCIEQLKPRVEKERIVNRVRKTEKTISELKTEAHGILDFLSTNVAPLLRESVKDAGTEEYVRDNNVPSNPPRLTFDYSSPLTPEGQLRASVVEEGGSRVVAVVAHGQGGVGKTCALRGLADDDQIRKRFSGGTLYVQLGEDATVSTMIQEISKIVKRTGSCSLASKLEGAKTIQAAADEASIWFRGQRCLFLVDDIWHRNGIDSGVLRALGTMVNERSRMVYTTRDQRFLSGCEREIRFSEKETHGEVARRILMTHGGFDWKRKLNERNEEAITGVLEVCQGLPLALAIAGETVRKELRAREGVKENVWGDLYEMMRWNIVEGKAEGYGGVHRIVDTSLKVLDSGEGEGRFVRMFRALCVLEKQQRVPTEMLRKLWDLEDVKKTEEVVNLLDEVSVVRKVVLDGGKVFIHLHDLILDIAVRKAEEKGEVKRTFRRLVENYIAEDKKRKEASNMESAAKVVVQGPSTRKRGGLLRWAEKVCCVKTSGTGHKSSEVREEYLEETMKNERAMWEWWKCDDDGYIHDNICQVLQGAGLKEELVWLLSKPHWIVSRLQNSGIYGVERDLEIGKSVIRRANGGGEGHVKHMEVVGKAARMGCRYVNDNKREAWFQIHGRLLWYADQCGRTKRFVEEMEKCAPRPWAKASMGLLQQAGISASDIVPVCGAVCSVQMDDEKLVCSWMDDDNITLGITQYFFGSGATETEERECYEFCDAEGPRCITFSQDLRRAVVGSEDGTVWIWELETGRRKRCTERHDGIVDCVAISPDGSLIVSGSEDATVRVWEMSSGEPVEEPFVGHADWVGCAAWSGDGTRVVSGSSDGTIQVWEVSSGEPVGEPMVGHTGEVRCVAWNPDGRCVASGSDDKTVRVWEVGSGEPVGQALVGHTGTVWSVGWSGDGRRVVSGSGDNTVRVWEVGSGEPVGQPLVGHTGTVWCVAWSGDGRRVVSGSDDTTMRVWEVGGGESVGQPVVGDRGFVRCVALSGDGRRIVSGSRDGTVRVWEASSGEPVGQPLVGHTDMVGCVAWSPNGRQVASGSRDETVRVWEVGSGEPAGPPLGHTKGVRCIAWSGDGRLVVSGSWDRAVRVWEVGSGELVGRPFEHDGSVFEVGVNEDGSQVVSYDVELCGSRGVSEDREHVGRIWNVASGDCIVTSRDKEWGTGLCTLQEQGLSYSESEPLSDVVTYEQQDGSEVVLGTCENFGWQFGEVWFSDASYTHCKVET